jgi:hypothetical protein
VASLAVAVAGRRDHPLSGVQFGSGLIAVLPGRTPRTVLWQAACPGNKIGIRGRRSPDARVPLDSRSSSTFVPPFPAQRGPAFLKCRARVGKQSPAIVRQHLQVHIYR